MTQTTTAFSAIDCVIKADNAAGTLTDISGSANKFEIKFPHGVGEYRTFGSQWKGRLVIGKDCEIALTFVCSTTADETYDLLKDWYHGGNDSPRSCQFDVPDSSVGSDRFTGEFVLADLNMPFDAGADEVVMGTATLKPNGAVSHATISV